MTKDQLTWAAVVAAALLGLALLSRWNADSRNRIVIPIDGGRCPCPDGRCPWN
jgi:hypothetical protein